MSRSHWTDEEISLRVMAYLDGELNPEEMDEVRAKVAADEKYREVMESLMAVKEATDKMKLKKLPEMYWDEYWKHVYNRIERGIGWIFISIGALILSLYGVWVFFKTILQDVSLNPILKAGILILAIGLVILVISILREKLMVRNVDKYREIER